MTYEEFINNILETRGRFECGEEYHERHHIVPKCMGGSNDEENLIDLFAREHFEAHRLLAIENPENSKLTYAWWCMCSFPGYSKNREEVIAEEYEEARIVFLKNFSGEKSTWYGRHHTEEVKQKIDESTIKSQGAKRYLQTEVGQQKYKNTCLEKEICKVGFPVNSLNKYIEKLN